MSTIKEALQDYVATVNSGKYGDDYETLNSKFPELSSYDQGVLDDYVATVNSGKYGDDWETLNSKFPEFNFGVEPEEVEPTKAVETPKGETAEVGSGALDSTSADTTSLLDLKKQLEDKLTQPKSTVDGGTDRFMSADNILKKRQEGKRIGEINKKTLNTLDEGVKQGYKDKATQKLTEEYTEAYKDSQEGFTLNDSMIEQEATKLLREDKDKELYEKTNMWGQTLYKLGAGSLSTLSGLAGIPNFANKTMFTLLASDEELEMLNTLTPEQREAVVSNISGATTGNATAMLSAKTQNYLKAEADKVGEKIVQFDQTLGEDFANGDWGKGIFRTFND